MGRLTRTTSLHVMALTLVVILAAILRFADLPSRGLIYWDEGKFLLEGVRLQTGLHLLAGERGSLPNGKAIGTAKPTHAFLIALSFALLGLHDYSALFLNAGASVLGVVVVYLIGAVLFDRIVGLVAALVLAVSEYDVIYARSALSESDANALLLLGVLIWLQARRDGTPKRRKFAALAAAALVFGLAFTTNYRTIVYVAVIIGFDLLYSLKQRGPSPSVIRSLTWVAGFAVAPALWQLVDVVARARGTVLFRSEITHRPATYLGEVLYQIHGGKQAEILFGPLPYLQWYVAYEGWVLSLLLALGLVMALRVRSFPWLAVLCPVAIPYLLYVWAPIIVPRNLAAAVPFASLLIAAALVLIIRRIAPGRLFLAAVLIASVLVGAEGARHSWRLSAERSGLTRATQYVVSRHARLVLSTNEIPFFYLRGNGGRCYAAKVPHSLPRLSADARAGYSYVIMDHHSWSVARFIHDRMRRVARYPATETTAIGENLIAAENTHTPHGPYPVPYVEVLLLTTAGLPPTEGVAAQVCNLNVL